MKKGFSYLLIIFATVVLVGIAGGAYYLGTKSASQKTLVLPTGKPQLTTSPTETQEAKQPLFSGKIKKLNKDLGLFKITDADKENGVQSSIVYYEAGTFLRGEYSGYTRVIAIRPAEGPGPSLQFVLATKDYSSYLLDDPQNKTSNYPSDDWDNPYMYIDKSKIAKTVLLDSDHPKTITVDAPFKLIKEDSILLENNKIGKKDANGNDIYQESPITEFAAPDKLPSIQTNLTLYTGGTDWSNVQPQNEKEKTALATRKQYLNKTTLVHAQDSTGLTYSYVLAPEKDVDTYVQGLEAEEQKNIEYKKQVKLFNEKKLKEYPPSFEHLAFPGLRIPKSSGVLSADYYSTYDSAFPGACGGNQSTYIASSITEIDLKPVPSNSIFPLFELKDTKHPLYVLAYQTKTDQGDESFRAVNDNKSIPTLAEYVAKHPLLFFKDAWGRWVIIGEFDLKLMGGCGKPVVYLYPEKPTVVHLSFGSSIALNTNIPTYHDGWLVRANPDGALTDLQPQYTDCSQIDSLKFGSEYAGNACKTNSYPYIYWSGKSVEKTYPQVSVGWIVEKENLSSFMHGKLGEMGLTEKESNDMISYWVPKMKERNTPYYQIGFLQTQDMNAFIPMNVNPKPDSVLRVFLDWKALSRKPIQDLAPQQLNKFNRTGFTYVEWGGLQ
jgi:hypothetical protein